MREVGGRRGPAAIVAAFAVAAVVGCGDPAPTDVGEPSEDGAVFGQSQCLGVVTSKCNEILRDAQRQGVVATIRIVCTKLPCTERQGEVTVDVVYANGMRTSQGQGWGTVDGGTIQVPDPIPVLAPTPVGPDPSG